MLRNASILLGPHVFLAGALLLDGPAAVACAAAWIAGQAIAIGALLSPGSRLYGPIVRCGENQPRVALTFDDGPHPDDTPAILSALERAGARATFFFVGRKARAHPDLVRRAASEGHGVAVHSDTHPWWFSLAGPKRVQREVHDAARTLHEITGRRPRFFRPPMGHKNIFLTDALASADLSLVVWTARAYDTVIRSPGRIRDRLLARAEPGGILLLHEGVRRDPGRPSPTVEALPDLIADLRARGLDPVSLEDLRGIQAPPPGRSPRGAGDGGAAAT